MDNFEEYFIEGTTILKNKFNITNKQELIQKENEICLEKLTYLYLNPIPLDFDANHLKMIHKFLFEDIYDFAGIYRKTNITKNNAHFELQENISYRIDYSLKQMNEEVEHIQVGEYPYFIAGFYYELIMCHPFREGNGRTIREFLREFVLEKFKGYELDFEKMDSNNLLMGVKERLLYPSLLEYEFSKALVRKEKTL